MEYNTITAIDIGTTKIATIVAQYSKSGSIEILGHSVVPCKGLSKGNVVDVEKTSEGINQSISILKQYYNLNIKSAFLGITGSHVNFEDRLVKNIFKEYKQSTHNNKKFNLVNKKVIKPEYKEQLKNPSSRSAKLRIIERLA